MTPIHDTYVYLKMKQFENYDYILKIFWGLLSPNPLPKMLFLKDIWIYYCIL